jgi:hypothetical protein
MLQLVLHTIIVSAICIVWGLPALLIMKKKSTKENFWRRSVLEHFIFLFFSGLISIAVISSWAYLVIPLKFDYLLLLTLILLLVLFLFAGKKITEILKLFVPAQMPVLYLVFIAVCLLLFFILGTLKPVNGDTQIYHLQIIRWTSEYEAIPGLANLYPRLGLGSNWFNLVSFFHIPAFKHQNFTYVNTSLVIWFFLWLLNNWKYHHFNREKQPAHKILSLFYFLILLYCLFDWQLFRDTANSTSYDFIVTALTITALSFLLERILFSYENDSFSFLFIVLCIAIIPFKLSGIFILLPALSHLLKFNSRLNWLKAIIAGCLIITPVLIKNYILSGYPLYPLPYSFTAPDWQVPEDMTANLQDHIISANRFYNKTTGFIRDFEATSFNWIPHWFKGILLQHKIILALSLSSVLLLFFKTKLSVNHKQLRIFIALLFLMTAGWFFTAPDPRFGYGVLLCLSFLPVSIIAGKYMQPVFYNILIIAAIGISLFYLYRKASPILKEPNHIFYPTELQKPVLKTITVSGINFNVPVISGTESNDNCLNTELPCISQENPYLQPRGQSLKQGFKMNPQPDSIFIRNYNY